VQSFDWEMDNYKVCIEFFIFSDSILGRASVFNLRVTMQDFIDDLVEGEVLPEDEKENFKVHIPVIFLLGLL
jgi:hypothetical protein